MTEKVVRSDAVSPGMQDLFFLRILLLNRIYFLSSAWWQNL